MTLCGLSEYIDVTGGVTDTVDYILRLARFFGIPFARSLHFMFALLLVIQMKRFRRNMIVSI